MSPRGYEYPARRGIDRELYVAGNARILRAMTEAALSLVGVSVEVLPVGDREVSPAVNATRVAAERLFVQSGDEAFSPDQRAFGAQLDIENHNGGVVAVGFGGEDVDPVAQRESFLLLTVQELQGAGEGLDELANDAARARVEIEAVNSASLVRSEQ